MKKPSPKSNSQPKEPAKPKPAAKGKHHPNRDGEKHLEELVRELQE